MSSNTQNGSVNGANGSGATQKSGKVRLMRTVPIGKKLAVMAGSMLVPLFALLVAFVFNLNKTIVFTGKEQAGLAYVDILADVGSHVSEHGVAVGSAMTGSKDADAAARKLAAETDEIVAKLDQEDAHYAKAAATLGWKAIHAQWESLKSTTFKSTEEAYDAHHKMLDAIYSLKDAVVMESNLALDPEAGSYYAIDVSTGKLPEIARFFGDARANLVAVQAHGTPSTEQRRALVAQLGVLQDRLDSTKSELTAAADAFQDRPATLAHVKEIPANWQDGIAAWVVEANKLVLAPSIPADAVKELITRASGLTAQLDKVQNQATTASISALDTRNGSDRRVMWITSISCLLAVAFAIWLVMQISKRIAGAIIRLRNISLNVAQGRYDNVIDTRGTDEVSVLFTALNTMQVQLLQEQKNREVAEASIMRLSRALDAASTNVMVADTNNDIIYMNQSVGKFFKDRESNLRRDLPNFSSEKLLNSNIDQFHRTPSHQKNLLANLRGMHRGEMVVGGLSIVVIANPIFDDSGKRMGTVVEWLDRTMEVAANKEVADLVTAVNNGELSARIVEEGKTGFYKVIAGGLNQLVGNVSDVVQAVHQLVDAARSGDLTARMQFEGKPGLNRTLGEGINDLVDEVATVVDEVQKLVTSANEGDLTKRMPVEGRSGLFMKVGSGVNGLTENMANVISQVKEAASEVHRGADEISQGNTNLSQRTEEQASSLEETASSMEEMTSTVKQNADNAGQANQLAVAARDQAEKGGAVVAKAVRAMTDINDASKKIADIIGVIDEIAFQTNLLALNAAVEAARAGEQGRGFAVVATEVRNLAGRSATAAKEIKGLIQDSVRKVDEGSSLVTQSGVTLEQIVSAVKKVTDIVAEIAAASQEQSSGIEQVNKAVMQLDELTQQNAALVEQASAASQSMAEQARTLNDSMARYTVSGGGATRASAPVRAVSAASSRPAAPARPAASRPYAVKTSSTAIKRVRDTSAAPVEATGTDDAVWKEF